MILIMYLLSLLCIVLLLMAMQHEVDATVTLYVLFVVWILWCAGGQLNNNFLLITSGQIFVIISIAVYMYASVLYCMCKTN